MHISSKESYMQTINFDLHKTVHTIMIEVQPEQWEYIVHTGDDYSSYKLTKNVHEALPLNIANTDKIVTIIQRIIKQTKNYKHGMVQLVEIKYTAKHETVDLDQPPYITERRSKALKKLSPDDIYALGIEKLAMYEKLSKDQE